MTDINEFRPQNRQDWRRWLEVNHQNEDAIWLIFIKKKSPDYNLSWSEAVDEALCFGWIDSTKKTIDKDSYKHYFSKRKAKSNWSKVNKDKVEKLTAQGLMRKVGEQSIAIAKENGSWNVLDAIEVLIVPDDLLDELNKSQPALAFFNGLSDSVKKRLLYWVYSAKKDETRLKRILEIVDNAKQGKRPSQFN